MLPGKALNSPEVLEALFGLSGEDSVLLGDKDRVLELERGAALRLRFHLGSPEGPVVLLFPGEGEEAGAYDPAGEFLAREDVSLVVAEPRGTGASKGEPDCARLLDDGAKVFEHLAAWRKEKGFTGPVVVMGSSLGSAVALETARRFPEEVSGIIIFSGFSRTTVLLGGLGLDTRALGIAEEDGFGNLEKIEMLDIPVLIVHGQEDDVSPIQEAMSLHQYSPAKSKELVVVPGAGHGGLLAAGGVRLLTHLVTFAEKLTGKRKRRKKYLRSKKDS